MAKKPEPGSRCNQPEPTRDTLALSGKAPHARTRVHRVLRSRYGVVLAETTCGGHAVGKMRTGWEVPRGVVIHRTVDAATAEYLEAMQ